jgi:predicted dehydrogenase
MTLPMACVAAIADQDLEKRRAAKSFPNVVVAQTLDDLLQEQLSAVIVATPASTHAAIVSAALAAGIHVFCEKPLALSYDASTKLVAIAVQRGRVLHVDHTFLFTEQFKHIESLFRTAPIRSYRSHRINVSPGRDDVSIIEDLATHDLALLDALTADEPESIRLSAPGWPSSDSATLTMRFTRGCVARVHVGWRQASKRRDIALSNEHTSILWRDSTLTIQRGRTPEFLSPPEGPTRDGLTNSLLTFLNCIETSSLANAEARRAIRIASVFDRIRASLTVGMAFANA